MAELILPAKTSIFRREAAILGLKFDDWYGGGQLCKAGFWGDAILAKVDRRDDTLGDTLGYDIKGYGMPRTVLKFVSALEEAGLKCFVTFETDQPIAWNT